MNIIYFQEPLAEHEKQVLYTEFSNYEFVFDSNPPSPQQWKHIEIVYGNRLSLQELHMAPELHWIHVPNPFLHNLCLDELFQHTNILVTNTRLEHLPQIGEYLWASTLAFAKQLFWNSTSTPWQLTERCFLQVGMGYVGQELTRRAHILGCKVWGVSSHRSTYEYCHKSFEKKYLHNILPHADIVSIFSIRQGSFPIAFAKAEFELMKQDSILVILGSRQGVSEADLYEVAKDAKFRGIIIDAFPHAPVDKASPLRTLPHSLITTDASSQPKGAQKLSFQTFKRNLRLFENGNFNNMKNLITPDTYY